MLSDPRASIETFTITNLYDVFPSVIMSTMPFVKIEMRRQQKNLMYASIIV